MTIVKCEKLLIPQSADGLKFAESYEKQLKDQGVFISRKEDTQNIILEARYPFCVDGYGSDTPTTQYNIPVMYYPQVDGVTPSVIVQDDGGNK